eukprot:9382347-Alexandrium_andersonii.AAC.1
MARPDAMRGRCGAAQDHASWKPAEEGGQHRCNTVPATSPRQARKALHNCGFQATSAPLLQAGARAPC